MNSLEEIKKYGFTGFVSIVELGKDFNIIPNERGVYLILKLDLELSFKKIGDGAYFKNEDPNVDIKILKQKWLENNIILYVGQAGGIRLGNWSNSTLKERIKAYIKFGNGKAIGHRGGRLIWQIENNKNLIVCWKELKDKIDDPCKIETQLLNDFKLRNNDKLPFANLRN
jgi:hypothetical protein